MYAVIFEVTPFENSAQVYFDTAAALKDALQQVEGFISVERFQSLTEPQKYLSLSFWESEAAIQRWREYHEHRLAQARGKAELFRRFRIRVGQVLRDYGHSA